MTSFMNYLFLWNQVDALQNQFRRDRVHCTSWYYGILKHLFIRVFFFFFIYVYTEMTQSLLQDHSPPSSIPATPNMTFSTPTARVGPSTFFTPITLPQLTPEQWRIIQTLTQQGMAAFYELYGPRRDKRALRT